jgi:methionyl aminopeptidase
MEKYEKAGKIVANVRKKAVDIVKPEMKVLDLINMIEGEIINQGANPAFPCNISINDITAHYTSPENDETVLKTGDMVKIDLGAHVDGYIADSAVTAIIGSDDEIIDVLGEETYQKNLKMVDASLSGLENALSIIKAGVELSEIGKTVEETINSFGFRPVANLTGHSMDQWILHAGLSIPNISEKNTHKLEEGDVLAIEPFATDGVGMVTDMPQTYIFRFLRDRPMRVMHDKKVMSHIKMGYKILPFAQRWLAGSFDEKRLNASMRQLIRSRAVYPYHVLREKSGAWVSQAEHTVIVEKEGCQIITE